MTCEQCINKLDAMDNGPIDADTMRHLQACPECAKEAAAFELALRLYRLPDSVSSTDIEASVISMLHLVDAPRRIVSMRNWLMAGMLLFISIMIVPLSNHVESIRIVTNQGTVFSTSLVLGLVITIYSGMFVLSHLDEFSKRLKEKGLLSHS